MVKTFKYLFLLQQIQQKLKKSYQNQNYYERSQGKIKGILRR